MHEFYTLDTIDSVEHPIPNGNTLNGKSEEQLDYQKMVNLNLWILASGKKLLAKWIDTVFIYKKEENDKAKKFHLIIKLFILTTYRNKKYSWLWMFSTKKLLTSRNIMISTI